MSCGWNGVLLAVLASCSKPSENAPVNGPLDAVLTLYVSNQSSAISEVDIQVSVDGRRVVDGVFSVGMGHGGEQYELPLTKGKHELHASSSKGSTHYDTVIDLQGKHWGSLFFWYQPAEPGQGGPQPRSFTFELQDTPMTLR